MEAQATKISIILDIEEALSLRKIHGNMTRAEMKADGYTEMDMDVSERLFNVIDDLFSLPKNDKETRR